jgi:cystathionine beta-lyase
MQGEIIIQTLIYYIMNFSTKAIHIGNSPDPSTGAIIPPIYMTSTYIQEAPDQHKGYDYTRAGNPNFTNLEQSLAVLEDAEHATIFSSGLAAITALASSLDSGDHVLATIDLYGGTHRLFRDVFTSFGVGFELVDTQDLSAVKASLKNKPKFLLLESPTNPLLNISDIRSISKLSHEQGVQVIVDNTFASPYFQQPLSLEADVVLHSTTKYIGGHSDVVGGAVMTNDQKIKDKMDFARKALGLNPSPFDAWLTSRGLKTLALRMNQHQKNALKVAHFFQEHPIVRKVYYPGLASHRNYEIAKAQMSGYSGIVSVDFDLSTEQTKQLISSFKLFSLAESLGGVESLVDHPASMTHASMSPEAREEAGISDSLVRFSVGIEDEGDLIEDLEKRLSEY